MESKYGALRLTSFEQREHHAWSEYMKARMCLLQEDGGKSGYWDHLGNAMASLPESDYLYGVFASSLLSIRDAKEHLRLLKAAWEKNRRHSKLALLYANVLSEQKQDDAALGVILGSLVESDWSDGSLVFRYVQHTSSGNRSELIERNLDRAFRRTHGNDRLLILAGYGCYWNDLLMVERSLWQRDTSLGHWGRLRSRLRQSRYESKSRSCLEEAVAGVSSMELINLVFVLRACEDQKNYELWARYLEALVSCDHDLAKSTWYFISSARRLKASGDLDGLRSYLSQIGAGDGWNTDILEFAGDAYWSDLQDYERAMDMYDELVRKHPKTESYRLHLAQLSLIRGMSMKGLAALAPIRRASALTREFRGRLHSQKGDYKSAYNELGSLLSDYHKNKLKLNKDRLISIYHSFVNACYQLGLVEESLKHVKELHEIDPDNASGCNFYGYLLAVYNRELPLAEKLLRKALKKDPLNAAFLDSLAWIRYRQGRYAEALKLMAKVIELGGLKEDGDGEISEHLSKIHQALGNDKLAKFYWDLAVEKNPKLKHDEK